MNVTGVIIDKGRYFQKWRNQHFYFPARFGHKTCFWFDLV